MTPPAAIEVEAVTDTQGITLPEPTTLPHKSNHNYFHDASSKPRENGPKSQWGTAAACSSAQFKSPQHASTNKPNAKRWDTLLTPESLARKGSTLKNAARFLSKPGIISLGGGLPSSAYFPFTELAVTVPTVPKFSEQEMLETGGTKLVAGKHDLQTGKSIFDIGTAFNYGQGSGSAQLLRWVTEHTELVHDPPYADWACNLTIGSTSAFDMAMRMFVRRGEYILAEQYTFPTAVEATVPMDIRMVGIEMDKEGILPLVLDHIMSTWDPNERHGACKPRVLYTVPTGQNPTGATMGTERRRDIYKVCQKHDIFILEDEPYYFLQMPDYERSDKLAPDAGTIDHETFLRTLIPSFLSMDIDGRVMRMDSFSKVVAPGSRIGWVTASEQLIERYRTHVDCSTQGPCGYSQLVLFKMLDEHWGHSGYIDWLKHIRTEYTRRRDVIVRACEDHLPLEVVRWVPPTAGMFHWMEVDWKQHPLSESWSMTEIENQIFTASVDKGALVTCGSWFFSDSTIEQERMFFRATFAAAPADQIDAAIQRFGHAIREVFGLRNRLNGD